MLSAVALNVFSQTPPTAANLPVREKDPKVSYPISVEYPVEKAVYEDLKNIFIFGSVFSASAKLKVNGAAVPVYKTGGWLAYIPVVYGENQILIEASLAGKTFSAIRRVTITGFNPDKYKDAPAFDADCTLPQKNLILKEGDTVDLKACATPGAEVTYTISGIKNADEVPMREDAPGIYKASYVLSDKDKADGAKITYKLNTKIKFSPAVTLRILQAEEIPIVGEVEDYGTRVRTQAVGQGSLFPFHRLYDHVLIDGKNNGMFRVMLDGNNIAWVEEAKIKIKEKSNFVQNKISVVQSSREEGKTKIVFFSEKKVPLTVQDSEDAFYITFFYTNEFEDRYIFDAGDELVDNISHEFLSGSTVRFKIDKTPGKFWGFDYSHDEANNLVLYLFHKKDFNEGTVDQPLKGIKIFLDPGHSPKRTPGYDGAVGPTGLLEYEVNMAIAKELAPKLTAAGAQVILSKNEKEQTSLTQRVQRALDAQADIFISIHQNALPQGVNPFNKKRGMAVYYFYPHSLKLAESVNKTMSKNLPTLENNGVMVGDLFVVRMPQMPSILIENAFMMFPEQEEMMKEDKLRAKFVQGIYEGVFEFFGKPLPPAPKPAPAKKPVAKKPVAKKVTKK